MSGETHLCPGVSGKDTRRRSSQLTDRGLREHMSTLIRSQAAKAALCVFGAEKRWNNVADEAKEAGG